MRKVSKGGELAPFASCTVQLPAAQDWRWCGTCAILAPASYGQEVKARATSASHQRAWLCAHIMTVCHREILKNRFEKDHKVLSMDTLFSTQLHSVIFIFILWLSNMWHWSHLLHDLQNFMSENSERKQYLLHVKPRRFLSEGNMLRSASSHNYLTNFNRGFLNTVPVCLLQLDHLSHLSDGG